ncbi:MAG: hypothetical protein M3203_16315 [Actinomycetota bacterium]|nr:hypothetical protein [Actinomycetota bacterium]
MKALEAHKPLEAMRQLATERLSEGSTREQIRNELEQLRRQLQAESREADEDIVLEVLDLIEGWCSPHMTI